MKFAFSRRNLLLGGAAIGVVGLGVGAYGLSASGADFFRAMLKSYLPDANIPEETIRAFAEAAALGREADFAPKLKALSAAVRVVGFEAVSAGFSGDYAFTKFNREFLTAFLLGSNYFDIADPTTEEIVFYAMPRVCINRFAQFQRDE